VRRTGRDTQSIVVWWLRTLLYRRSVRVIGVLVLLAAVTAGALLAYDATRPAQTSAPSPTGVGGLVGPVNPAARICSDALGTMSTIAAATPVTAVSEPDRYTFSKAYSTARKSCTYREYVAWEQQVLVPWSRGGELEDVLGTTGGAS
jgi:hypothetical protein